MRLNPIAIRFFVAVLILAPLGYGVNAALRPRKQRLLSISEQHTLAFKESLEEFAWIFATVDKETRDAWAELSDEDFAAELGRRGGPRARKAARLARYHLRLWLKYQNAAQYPWLPVEADPPPPRK